MRKLFQLTTISLLAALSFGCSKDSVAPDDNLDAKLTLKVECPPTEGSVTITPQKTTYTSGDKVELTAKPADGYEFKGWSMPDATVQTISTISYTITQDATLKAVFEKKGEAATCQVKATCDPNQGSVSISPQKEAYRKLDIVQVEATPKEGYVFDRWEGITASGSRATICIDGSLAIKAIFKKKEGTTEKPEFIFTAMRLRDKSGTYYLHVSAIFSPLAYQDEEATLKIKSKTYTMTYNQLNQNFADVAAGTPIAVELTHKSLSKPLSVTIIIPENFTPAAERLLLSTENNNKLTWKPLQCSGYYRRVLMGNSTGWVEFQQAFNLTTQTELTYSANELLNENEVVTNMPYTRYAITVVPANTVTNLPGFSANSRVVAMGSESKWVTNYKDANFWGIW